jgi:ribonuclease HI
MTASSIEIWIHGACTGSGYGGWSYVVLGAEAARGMAGGATRTDLERMELEGVAAALEGLSDASRSGGLTLHLASPLLIAALASPVADQTNPALRARIAKALAGWPGKPAIIDARRAPNAKAWADFLGSWAEFARDKAKLRGGFSAAIPKLNIAKFVQDAI